ncbi:MAG: superoxide dismutase [Thaumarchaeota archaeon]|jgi:Fe-Mn family superoxide dismutase|nr:superoxide dismutase [Nitrososphaerota archaeon]MBT5843145.1 superoxide dismutase [Nitrososphaerota archaeon]MBT6468027.1 superoxide dismutase [Nitrososphaerota archaeon]
MVQYELPKLSYGYDELEPFIDTQTMKIHHQKHNQSYVDGLNNALVEIGGASHPQYISSILSDLQTIPESSRNKIDFFGGGFENHKLFWETMNPDGGGVPKGKLEDAIDVYFEDFENFKKIFSEKAVNIQGSGWCWLVFNRTFNKIEILTTQNQTSPWTLQKVPLLGLDVWEHAYYLKYQNKRPEYVDAWWNVVNWDYVENRFSEISG